MSARTALAAVVTLGVLEEFEILKFSFELFHGPDFDWYVRCCPRSADLLSRYGNVHCAVFQTTHPRFDTDNPSFNRVVEQKMNALEDAWESGLCDSAMFLDSDLIVTDAFLNDFALLDGEVLLSPHYWPEERSADVDKYGYFNSGFVLARTAEFHKWWREAFLSQPQKFTDQQCLDDAPDHFAVRTLGEEANVGFWRAANGTTKLSTFKIPENCKFLHVHLFQPAGTRAELLCRIFAKQYLAFTTDAEISMRPFSWYQLQSKAFAFQCLAFLREGKQEGHRQLYDEILARDPLQLYSAVLEQRSSSKEKLEYAT